MIRGDHSQFQNVRFRESLISGMFDFRSSNKDRRIDDSEVGAYSVVVEARVPMRCNERVDMFWGKEKSDRRWKQRIGVVCLEYSSRMYYVVVLLLFAFLFYVAFEFVSEFGRKL